MKGKPVAFEEFKNMNILRKLISSFPNLILAEDETYEITDEVTLLRGIVRIGHLPTLKYMIVPIESLPLTKEFLKAATKAFFTKRCDSYKLFKIIR